DTNKPSSGVLMLYLSKCAYILYYCTQTTYFIIHEFKTTIYKAVFSWGGCCGCRWRRICGKRHSGGREASGNFYMGFWSRRQSGCLGSAEKQRTCLRCG